MALALVALKGYNPVMDRLEFLHVCPVQPLRAFRVFAHESDFLQHAQVLRDHRLRPAQQFHQVIHGPFIRTQCIEDFAPLWLGHGIERVVGSWGTRQTGIIFLYGNM